MTHKIIIEKNNKEFACVEYKDHLIFAADNFNSKDIYL